MEKEVWKRYKAQGVQVLGISVQEGVAKPILKLKQFRKDHALTYPLLSDEPGDLALRFDATGLPAIALLNRKHEYIGTYHELKDVEDGIKKLLH